MPSVTPEQKRFMAGCARGWKPKGKGMKCPPQKVSKEYVRADMLRKMGKS